MIKSTVLNDINKLYFYLFRMAGIQINIIKGVYGNMRMNKISNKSHNINQM